MDVQMPEMDGRGHVKVRGQEKKTGKHIKIVAMTAHAMAGDKDRCLLAGVDAYVSKPLSVKDLFGTIEELFQAPVESRVPERTRLALPVPFWQGTLGLLLSYLW